MNAKTYDDLYTHRLQVLSSKKKKKRNILNMDKVDSILEKYKKDYGHKNKETGDWDYDTFERKEMLKQRDKYYKNR